MAQTGSLTSHLKMGNDPTTGGFSDYIVEQSHVDMMFL